MQGGHITIEPIYLEDLFQLGQSIYTLTLRGKDSLT